MVRIGIKRFFYKSLIILILISLVQDFFFLGSTYATSGTRTITFSESTQRSQSQTISIPNLYQVQSVSVDNGTVSHTRSGNNITVNVNNGNWVNRESSYDPYLYPKAVSTYRESSNNSFPNSVSYNDESGYSTSIIFKDGDSFVTSGEFIPFGSKTVTGVRGPQSSSTFPSSIPYNEDGFSGNLATNGAPRVSSGTFQAADSKEVTRTVAGTSYSTFECRPVPSGGGWSRIRSNYSPDPYNYNVDGYTGSLNVTGASGHPGAPTPAPSPCSNIGEFQQTSMSANIYYAGTVTRPETDTRRYMQDYSGTVTRLETDTRIYRQNYRGTAYRGGTTYSNHTYAYEVTINYTINRSPILTLVNGIENDHALLGATSGYSDINIRGNVRDPDGDTITITATLNGKSKTATASNTVVSRAFNIPFDIVDDDIPVGRHTVDVVARDGKGGIARQSFDIHVFTFAEDGVYVLVDDLVHFPVKYSDVENDSMYEDQYKFVHNPQHFENYDRMRGQVGADKLSPYEQSRVGVIEDSDLWRNNAYTSFPTVGHYEVYYRARDNPKDDDRFDEFRYWSAPTPALNVYVHRKPVAQFKAYMLLSNGEVQIADQSYDLDSISQQERGIKEKEWSYRRIGTTNWTEGYPTTLNPSWRYELRQVVEDYQGETDEFIGPIEIVDDFPNSPPVAGFTHDSPYFVGDEIQITSTAYDIDDDPLSHRYVINQPNGSSFTSTEVNPSFRADHVGAYTVVQYVNDGIHSDVSYSDTIIVEDLEITGSVGHKERWEEIHSEEGNPSHHFYSGESFMLEATVTDAPVNKVWVEFSGDQINNSILSLDTDLSYLSNTEWHGTLYDEAMAEPRSRLKNGPVRFTFYVEYQNGVVRDDIVVVEIIGSAYETLKFYRSQ
ncbi:hypothetical protein AB3N04_00425 (plasmid) [Alkalihalophilus sp. As8PL]|uniref:Uncharacterized protein n=1 Tax=Alkalihalophilus sp. As8PL TaxID=3237103 RepID=A0AB39BNX2_9BACI